MKKNDRDPWAEWGEIRLGPTAILLFNLQRILKRFRVSPYLFDQGRMQFPNLCIDVEKTIREAKNFLGHLQESTKINGDTHWASRLILSDDVLQRTFKKHPAVPEVIGSFKRSLTYLERFIYGEQAEVGNTLFLERFSVLSFDSAVNSSK